MPPFTADIEVRFRDIDALGHVNNAVVATYLEQARVRFLREHFGEDEGYDGGVLAHLAIDYERPIHYGEAVTVTIDVSELGRTSIPMTYEVRADGELAATAESVLVLWDAAAEAPREIPERWRERLLGH